MGGDYYDRDVGQADNSHPQQANINMGYSQQANEIMGKSTNLSNSLNPQRWKEDLLTCETVNPVIFALDVTGSMGDWSKIIYDKMPMFYGQIMTQKYLKDPSISFCAIGDATCDEAPLQVSEFGQGKEIDQLISKLFLEGGGGGNDHESYELAAYFYSKRCDISKSEIPFFFLTGDEGYWDEITASQIKNVIGCEFFQKTFSGYDAWQELKKKFNVFFIKKKFGQKEVYQWNKALGEERVLNITNPKACIDVILGAIAITSGTRTLEQYIEDMKARGQTKERIEEVINALKKYNEKFKNGKIKIVNHQGKLQQEHKEKQGNYEELKQVATKQIVNELNEEKLVYYKNLIELKRKFPLIIPAELICPLMDEIFFDPVMTVDGQTYERKAIENWFLHSQNSPITKEKLQSLNLLPNYIVKKLVDEYYRANVGSLN